jgi:hypothetical protein
MTTDENGATGFWVKITQDLGDIDQYLTERNGKVSEPRETENADEIKSMQLAGVY